MQRWRWKVCKEIVLNKPMFAAYSIVAEHLWKGKIWKGFRQTKEFRMQIMAMTLNKKLIQHARISKYVLVSQEELQTLMLALQKKSMTLFRSQLVMDTWACLAISRRSNGLLDSSTLREVRTTSFLYRKLLDECRLSLVHNNKCNQCSILSRNIFRIKWCLCSTNSYRWVSLWCNSRNLYYTHQLALQLQ